MNRIATGAIIAACLLSAAAHAHITLTYPGPRPGNVSQFGFPCGNNPDPGRTTSQFLLPGATVEVRWTEFIDHTGHFRISFDNDGQDAFVDPASITDFFGNPAVLADNIPNPLGSGPYSATITLPNIECNNCTLQLVQVIYDNPPYTTGPGSNDLDRACADLTLSVNANNVFANGFEAVVPQAP